MLTIDSLARDERVAPPEPSPPDRLRPARWRPSRSQLAVTAIGLLAAVLYTWGLSRNGTANAYYTAAVRSGAASWKAFFFGALDPGSFITVDKPPAALWLMELSVRLFGFSSWSMLLPEAAAGVGSVLILHRLVRKWAGDVAAHLAALGFALTPVAVLMFRFNNPDALLTLLCLGAAWALWSALETGRTRGLVASAALLGLAFETKMLQAFLVLPALAAVYLLAGPPRLGKRLLQLAAAGATLVVTAGWWVAIVALWPAASRPYIGSTSNNSILGLVFGYNGLSRVFGNTGGPGGGGGFGGTPGALRMFNTIVGGQIAWLIPLAAAGLVAGLWLTRRGSRTDRGRAGWLLWGGWAAVCAAVFSLSKGVFHPYYTVQLAPAVAALAGAGGVALWHVGRIHRWAAWTLPASVAATAAVAVGILDRTPTYDPGLRTAIIIATPIAAVGLLAALYLRHRVLASIAAVMAAATLLAGPAAYALTTIGRSNTGSTPAAGPATTGVGGGGFAGPDAAAPDDHALISYLEAHRNGAEYLVAVFGAQPAESIIIGSGQAVIAIGGFTGSDPAPTLAQFEKLVADGKVRYVLVQSGRFGGLGALPAGRPGRGPGGGGTTSSIASWVTSHGTAVSYGGSGNGTLYLVSGS